MLYDVNLRLLQRGFPEDVFWVTKLQHKLWIKTQRRLLPTDVFSFWKNHLFSKLLDHYLETHLKCGTQTDTRYSILDSTKSSFSRAVVQESRNTQKVTCHRKLFYLSVVSVLNILLTEYFIFNFFLLHIGKVCVAFI